MKKIIPLLFIVFILFGCKVEEITNLKISSDKSEIQANGTEKVTFTVTDISGKDVTSKVQLYQGNIPLPGAEFLSDIAGEYFFYAEYKLETSNTKKIIVKPVVKHVKNILIEDYTGTWCGYCPRVAKAIEDAVKWNENINIVAIHDDEDMRFSKVEQLKNEFGIEGFPTAIINRKYDWPFPENNGGLSEGFSGAAKCGISIETENGNKNGQVKVSVEFAGGFIAETKLVVYVTENDLRYNQVNFYPEFGANPIRNFRHNNVLRMSLTHVLGEDINSEINSIYTRDFQFELGDLKSAKTSVVAFVIDKQTNECLNSRTVDLGKTAGFQLLN